MDKIEPKLLLNYNRPNGQKVKMEINGYVNSYRSSKLHVFYEALVPGSSDQSNSMLTALSNSIFMEARSKNMSLAPFGHLDPAKFVMASTFVAMLIEDLKTDISVLGTWSFGNTAFGATLARARNINFVASEREFANICSKTNILISKANSLFIPVSGFAKRWFEHRRYIYKDDEGDRFSLYMYKLANYYQLDVNPNSVTVGQLLCKWITVSTGSTASPTILDKIELIDNILDSYLGDDDLVEFCTECLQANIAHLVIAPIKTQTTKDANGSDIISYVAPELKLQFSLDDVQGLENACFVYPVTSNSNYLDNEACTWDIFETNNELFCGKCGTGFGKLPAFYGTDYIDGWDGANFGDVLTDKMSISNRPIYTHAKVTSLPGINNLTRYVCAIGKRVTLQLQTRNVSRYCAGSLRVSTGTQTSTVVPVTVHSTEILVGYATYYRDASVNSVDQNRTVVPVIFDLIPENLVEGSALQVWIEAAFGFKPRIAVYVQVDGDAYPFISDYDYVVYVTDENLDLFFASNAWNDAQLVSSIEDLNTKDQSSK